jgi:hypothetical protein
MDWKEIEEKYLLENGELLLKTKYIAYIPERKRSEWRIGHHFFYEEKQIVNLEKKGKLFKSLHYFYIEMPIGKTDKEKKDIYDMIINNISSIINYDF